MTTKELKKLTDKQLTQLRNSANRLLNDREKAQENLVPDKVLSELVKKYQQWFDDGSVDVTVPATFSVDFVCIDDIYEIELNDSVYLEAAIDDIDAVVNAHPDVQARLKKLQKEYDAFSEEVKQASKECGITELRMWGMIEEEYSGLYGV